MDGGCLERRVGEAEREEVFLIQPLNCLDSTAHLGGPRRREI